MFGRVRRLQTESADLILLDQSPIFRWRLPARSGFGQGRGEEGREGVGRRPNISVSPPSFIPLTGPACRPPCAAGNHGGGKLEGSRAKASPLRQVRSNGSLMQKLLFNALILKVNKFFIQNRKKSLDKNSYIMYIVYIHKVKKSTGA